MLRGGVKSETAVVRHFFQGVLAFGAFQRFPGSKGNLSAGLLQLQKKRRRVSGGAAGFSITPVFITVGGVVTPRCRHALPVS